MAIETNTPIQPDFLGERELDHHNTKPVSVGARSVGEMETVSVLVPSYNHGRFVARSIRSIIGQSQRPLQLIVIDDGSEDDSVKKIDQELNNCPFESELIANTHKGLAKSLNEGLKRSHGKYFAYLGSDDVWLPEFLESRVKVLRSRSDAVLAYGHTFVINEEDQIIECTKDWAPYANGSAREMLLNLIVPFSPSVLYRRQALERHYWSEDAGLEDFDMYLRLSTEGEFAFDEQILCAWRSHGSNNSRDLEFMLNECLEALRRAVPSLQLTPKELEKARATLKWRYAGDLIRAGEKGAGTRLLCSNLKGAPSYGSIARNMVTLSLPTSILRWRKQYLQRRTVKFYGTLKADQ